MLLASGASRSACRGLIDDWLAGRGNLPKPPGSGTDHRRSGSQRTHRVDQPWRQRQRSCRAGLRDRAKVSRSRLCLCGYTAHRFVAVGGRAARQVELRIGEDHRASWRVAVAAGFTLAGTVESHVAATGKRMRIYAL